MPKYNIYVATLRPPWKFYRRWFMGVNWDDARVTAIASAKLLQGSKRNYYQVVRREMKYEHDYTYDNFYDFRTSQGTNTELLEYLLKAREEAKLGENDILLVFTKVQVKHSAREYIEMGSMMGRMIRPDELGMLREESFSSHTPRLHFVSQEHKIGVFSFANHMDPRIVASVIEGVVVGE